MLKIHILSPLTEATRRNLRTPLKILRIYRKCYITFETKKNYGNNKY